MCFKVFEIISATWKVQMTELEIIVIDFTCLLHSQVHIIWASFLCPTKAPQRFLAPQLMGRQNWFFPFSHQEGMEYISPGRLPRVGGKKAEGVSGTSRQQRHR